MNVELWLYKAFETSGSKNIGRYEYRDLGLQDHGCIVFWENMDLNISYE